MSKRKYREDFDEYMSDEEYNMILYGINEDQGKTINEIIFNLRKQYDYTQEEVAKKLGIKQNTLSRYEHGDRQIPFFMLRKIMEIYGLKYELVPIDKNNNKAIEKYFNALMTKF